MDFQDTPDEAAWRDECRAWLDEHAPELKKVEGDFLAKARAWQALKFDGGFVKVPWEPEYGGRNGTPMQQIIFNQEESRRRLPPNLFIIGLNFIAPTIRAHGTAFQKERYLVKLLRGDEFWCQLFSEPGAGSDVASLATSAVRDGDEWWVINGQKVWTSAAHLADYGEILCRTDPDAPKHRGITAFVVDMKAPGVTVRPLRQMTGGADFNEVFFTDVRVPADHVLGEVNDGWNVAVTTLSNEKSSIGSGSAGRDTSAVAIRLADLARDRGVIDDPSVRQRIADVWIRTRIQGFVANRTLSAASRGGVPGAEGSIGKLASAVLETDIAEAAMGILGPHGVAATDGGHDRWRLRFLYAPGGHLGGGSDNINRNLLAERVLGLPGEPRTDDVVPWRELPR